MGKAIILAKCQVLSNVKIAKLRLGGKRVQENKKIRDIKSGKVKQGKNEAVGNEIDKYRAVYVWYLNVMICSQCLCFSVGLA